MTVSAAIDISSGSNAGLLARYSEPGDFNAYLGLMQPVSGGTFAAQIWKITGSSWENLTHSPVGEGTNDKALGIGLKVPARRAVRDQMPIVY